MQVENKYYTPDIKEFRVGFECEFFNNIQDKQWNKIVCDTDHIGIAYTCFEEGTIEWEDDISHTFRVKYIDSEDIVECGFKRSVYRTFYKISYIKYEKPIDNSEIVQLFHYENTNVIGITVPDFVRSKDESGSYRRRVLFEGKIKNKSELEVLLKQLEIR